MRRQDLEGLTREQLIAEAERLAVPRPRVLTQPELVDEIISRSTKNERERARARGWLGRARDLLARVVEKGLHLPDAARAIRSNDDRSWPAPPPPLPTVTLAEIYAAQGHLDRAVNVLDEVLAREPDHAEALLLRARFVEQAKTRAMRRGAAPAPEEVAAADDERDESDESDEDEDSTAPEGAASEARTDVSDEDVMPAAAADESVTPREAAEPVAASEATGADVSARDTLLTDVAASETTVSTAPARETAVAGSDATETAVAGSDASETAVAGSDAVPAVAADPALPARYDLDEIVAIAVDPRTIYLYWEVRATTLAHAQASAAEGALCVRVASVTASWDGPAVAVRDLRVDSLDGDRFIRDIQPGAHVRVSVGWLSGEVFAPFAVGIEVTAPHLAPSDAMATTVATWSPRPGAPVLQRQGGGHPGAVPAGGVHFGHQEPAAPFAGDASANGPRTDVAGQAGAQAPPFLGALFAGGPGRVGGREALVVSWNQQGWVVHPEGLVQEGRWFQPGGASELGREGPLYRLGGASELGRGGASELGRGLDA